MRINIVQPDIIWEDPESNKKKLTQIFDQVNGNVDVFLLPELFLTGFTMNVTELAVGMNGTHIEWMQSISQEYKACLCGSVIIKEKDKYFNRLIWMFPDGSLQYYDKRHLFRMGQENRYYYPGEKHLIISHNQWSIMPLICYDLRFPVWSRNTQSYDILVYHANWPAPRNHVWEVLLKARAIENQAYVIGVNRVGKDGTGINYTGNSMLVNPKGEIIISLGSEETTATIDIDLESLQEFRQKFPVYLDADSFKIKKE
jgi:omega-amidase